MRGLLRFLRELVRPSRSARSVPLGRVAIGSLLVFVVLFLVFTLSSQGVRLPFVSDAYTINAEFTDAAGLDPANAPAVSVAGVPEGVVTAVRYDAGRALVTMKLSRDVQGRLFRNATVRVRPFNAANFLEVDILPGDPAAGVLPPGATIDATQSSVPVNTDQVLDILDANTAAYLQLLTEQAAIALHGTGGVLTDALERLAPLSDEAKQIGAMLVLRRRMISQLVGATNVIFHTLADRHRQLASAISAATKLLGITTARSGEIESATNQLPALLAQADATTSSLSSLAPALEHALNDLSPTAAAFSTGLRAARNAVPALNEFISALRSVAQGTREPGRELVELAGQLGKGLAPAIAGYKEFTTIIDSIAAHRTQIQNASDGLSGVFSTQDSYGPLARVKLLGIEPPTATDLGLTAQDAQPRSNGYSRLQTMLASALTALCRRQTLACVFAAGTPGLPRSIVPASKGVVPILRNLSRPR